MVLSKHIEVKDVDAVCKLVNLLHKHSVNYIMNHTNVNDNTCYWFHIWCDSPAVRNMLSTFV